MPSTTSDAFHPRPLRLWPGVVLVLLQWLVRFVVPVVFPDAAPLGVLGGMVGGLAILIWWMFFSRAPWTERLGALGLTIVIMLAVSRLLHPSIAQGAMGMLFVVVAMPTVCLCFVAWAVASRRFTGATRWATMAAAILLGCGGWTLARTGGFDGNFKQDLAWRWTPTPEERLLARSDEPTPLPAVPPAVSAPTPATTAPAAAAASASTPVAATSPASPAPADVAVKAPGAAATAAASGGAAIDWPGFRGPSRDGIARGVRIETDWVKTPPVQLWRRPIGPGWSSFAVHGDLIYTQEQRGEDEIVACYRTTSGEPVWRHRDAARFWESNAGAGPRGTPTVRNGRLYAFGATGIVNALDARTGAVVWSRNAAADTGAKTPDWGFSSSPLVLDDLVVVAASGALVAYDLGSGAQRWTRTLGGTSYSSPQLATIGGVAQILLVSGAGAASVAPADGALLWEHAWPGSPIVQPAMTADGDVLISVNQGVGLRRLAVAHGADGWTTKERWTSLGLKPYFNDFVVHEGRAYGFDGGILSCIDLEDGARKWKGGRYGHGQLVLLPEQHLLLVLSEDGELALVNARPDQFTEVGRMPAIAGKTWNHPVLAGNVVLARNGEEMAAFRLATASR